MTNTVAGMHEEVHEEPESDPTELVDREVLQLIADYVKLSGARLKFISKDLIKIEIAPSDVHFFGDRRLHLIGLSLNSVERHAEAELPVIGSSFWAQLVAAIRSRGRRHAGGFLPVSVVGSTSGPNLPFTSAVAEVLDSRREIRRLGVFTIKVTLSAGTHVQEEIISSPVFDLTTNIPVEHSVAEAFFKTEPQAEVPEYPRAQEKDIHEVIELMSRGLEEKIQPRVDQLEKESSRELAFELERINRYYDRLKQEVRQEAGVGSSALKTIEYEHEKRRSEEIRRHGVRADLVPMQLDDRLVAAEVASWRLRSSGGNAAILFAQRYLVAEGKWITQCDRCGVQSSAIAVCSSGHAVGVECSAICSVCSEAFCNDHGYEACIVDGRPVCALHAEECFACEQPYCVKHQATCSRGGHLACVTCIQSCAVCGEKTCVKHGQWTSEAAPSGSRFLCGECVVYCEGSPSEAVGKDEADICHTCGNFICARHQVKCVVDGYVHCSKHLKKSDRSRRFICESHRAECALEPDLIFAEDEIRGCIECGTASCDSHGATCYEDSQWYCRTHLTTLSDLPNVFACRHHRSTCYVDGKPFSLRGTVDCDACSRQTCRAHSSKCSWCGGTVCVNDVIGDRCRTCTRLSPETEIPDEIIAALSKRPGHNKPKEWLIARDSTRYVVQLSFGWGRHLIAVIPIHAASIARLYKVSLIGRSQVE